MGYSETPEFRPRWGDAPAGGRTWEPHRPSNAPGERLGSRGDPAMTYADEAARASRDDGRPLLGTFRQNVMSLIVVAPSVVLNLYWVVHDGSGVDQAIFNIFWILIALASVRVAIRLVLDRLADEGRAKERPGDAAGSDAGASRPQRPEAGRRGAR